MFGLTPLKKEKANGGALARREDNPVLRLREEFDQLFNRFFGNVPATFGPEWDAWGGWGLEVQDGETEVVVRADAPGFEPQDFDVRVSGNVLTIPAEHQEGHGEANGGAGGERHRSFARSLTLPAEVAADRVEARYKNGVLELRLPRTEKSQPKRVEVKG